MYEGIVAEFGFEKARDYEAARTLNGVISSPVSEDRLAGLIREKVVFVIGAGDSLYEAIPVLKRYDVVRIAADSAVKTLLENGIWPDVVVTDLDGDEDSLVRAANSGAIMLVHAHGDNTDRLHLAEKFANCIGTAQGEAPGRVRNFDGFTDGDRCVFVADHFDAGKIVLFGMDFDGMIGAPSGTTPAEYDLKRKKLRRAKILLEWLAAKSDCEMYTTSGSITGFKHISYDGLGSIVGHKDSG